MDERCIGLLAVAQYQCLSAFIYADMSWVNFTTKEYLHDNLSN